MLALRVSACTGTWARPVPVPVPVLVLVLAARRYCTHLTYTQIQTLVNDFPLLLILASPLPKPTILYLNKSPTSLFSSLFISPLPTHRAFPTLRGAASLRASLLHKTSNHPHPRCSSCFTFVIGSPCRLQLRPRRIFFTCRCRRHSPALDDPCCLLLALPCPSLRLSATSPITSIWQTACGRLQWTT